MVAPHNHDHGEYTYTAVNVGAYIVIDSSFYIRLPSVPSALRSPAGEGALGGAG
jgi:hypothetical protein